MSAFSQGLAHVAMYREGKIPDLNMVHVENVIRSLDNFTDIELIDIAGESMVCAAKCPIGKNKVAIKVMLPVTTQKSTNFLRKKKVKLNVEECQKRFVRSIQMQRYVYENIKREQMFDKCRVPMVYRDIFSTKKGEPSFAYVMEYIDSMGLIKWCQKRTSDIDILKLYQNILAAFMHALHAYGIIHTDLKPDNILVSSNLPVIIDFGTCKNTQTKGQITSIRTVEMHSGIFTSERQKEFPTLRSYYEDIFSLGVILHCMLSRSMPPDLGDEGRLNVLIPKQMLPIQWQGFFSNAIDQQRKPFQTIAEMYQEFDRIYKDYRVTVVGGNTINTIDKEGVMKHITRHKSLCSSLIDVLNLLGEKNAE